jgi:hypothetical protein
MLDRVTSIFRFIYLFFMGMSLLTPFFTNAVTFNDFKTIVAFVLIAIPVGVYLYYLYQTALWNWQKKDYVPGVLSTIGLILHFVILVLLVSVLLSLNIDDKATGSGLLLTTVPFVLLLAVMGILDAMKFYKVWQRKSEA